MIMRPHDLALAACATVPVALCMPALADVPDYVPQLQARVSGFDGYNLPIGSSFSSGTPDIDEQGTVAFRLIGVGFTGIGGMWVGANGIGGIVYQAANADPVVTDPGIASGVVVFDQYTLAGSQGLRRHNVLTGQTSVAIQPGGAIGVFYFGSAQVLDDGRIGFRATIGSSGYAHVLHSAGVSSVIVGTPVAQPGSPYTFLFTPSFNQSGHVASKVQRAAGGNEIRIFRGDGTSTLIAADAAAAPGSPYTGFDNSVSLTNSGNVAFIASLGGGVRGVFLSDGTVTTPIARTQAGQLNEIEFFAPAASEKGLVAFRGRDGAGKRSIFVGDGTELVKVVGDGSPMPSDLGDAQIGRPDTSPVFGGSPRMNARGDIVFGCSITPLGNTSGTWGSAVYVLRAKESARPADINGDGEVNGLDLTALLAAWGACPSSGDCSADLDGSGAVDGLDLTAMLAGWG
jgi:hypothetical protein